MQIKTTMRYYLIIKKNTNNLDLGGCGAKGTFVLRWWECKRVPQCGGSSKKLKQSYHVAQKFHS